MSSTNDAQLECFYRDTVVEELHPGSHLPLIAWIDLEEHRRGEPTALRSASDVDAIAKHDFDCSVPCVAKINMIVNIVTDVITSIRAYC